MTAILIDRNKEFKIEYRFIPLFGHEVDYKQIEHFSNIRQTVREMLSVLASDERSIPEDLSEVNFYSTYLGCLVSVDTEEFVQDFIEFKRSKFKYDYTNYKPYVKPSQEEMVSYFLRALQSLKTRLETRIWDMAHYHATTESKRPKGHYW